MAKLQVSDKTSAESKKPEETVKKDENPKLKIEVERIRRKFSKIVRYDCREIGGSERKILVEAATKKHSNIDVISVGDIFEVITYPKADSLYGANLRRIDKG